MRFLAWFIAVSSLVLFCYSLHAKPLEKHEILEVLQSNPVKGYFRNCLQEIIQSKQFEIIFDVDKEGKTSLVSVHPPIDPEAQVCLKYSLEKIVFRATDNEYQITYIFDMPSYKKMSGSLQRDQQINVPTEMELKHTKTLGNVLIACAVVSSFAGLVSVIVSPVLYFMTWNFPEDDSLLYRYRIPLIVFLGGITSLGLSVVFFLAGKGKIVDAEIMEHKLRYPELAVSLTEDDTGAVTSLRWRF